MLRKLITWGAIFVLSIFISTQTAIEQGPAFFWSYIGFSVLTTLIVILVYRVTGELYDAGSTVMAFLAALLFLAIGLAISLLIAWLISAIFPMVDFYVAFQIMCLVLCFAPDNNKK